MRILINGGIFFFFFRFLRCPCGPSWTTPRRARSRANCSSSKCPSSDRNTLTISWQADPRTSRAPRTARTPSRPNSCARWPSRDNSKNHPLARRPLHPPPPPAPAPLPAPLLPLHHRRRPRQQKAQNRSRRARRCACDTSTCNLCTCSRTSLAPRSST